MLTDPLERPVETAVRENAPMRVRRTRALMAIGATIVLATVLGATATSGAQSLKASQRVYAYVTYYGWYDDTPPGCATAYSGCARGIGTYRQPITFASYDKEFPVGTLVYYPTLHKYFRMGDAPRRSVDRRQGWQSAQARSELYDFAV